MASALVIASEFFSKCRINFSQSTMNNNQNFYGYLIEYQKVSQVKKRKSCKHLKSRRLNLDFTRATHVDAVLHFRGRIREKKKGKEKNTDGMALRCM